MEVAYLLNEGERQVRLLMKIALNLKSILQFLTPYLYGTSKHSISGQLLLL